MQWLQILENLEMVVWADSIGTKVLLLVASGKTKR